jgi:Right handed beta helix region/Protein of unknown function (DUF1565)
MHPLGSRRSIIIRSLAVAAVLAFAAGAAAASQLSGDTSSAHDAGASVMPSTDAGPAPAVASARRPHRYVSPSGSDRASGTKAHPWRTVRHAARRVRPGMTVHVAPGRYAGAVRISRSGTEGRPVRFVSQRRGAARISASSRGAVTAVLITGDNVVFEGFDVTASGGDGTGGIEASGSHGAVIGNRVHDISMPCLQQGNGGAGIVIGSAIVDYRTRDVLVERNVISNIGDGPRDGRCRLVHGIYAEVPDATIANNIIYAAAGDGITSWHAARDLTIANNLSTANGGNGILIGSGDSGATRGNTGSTIVNNIVTRNGLSGINESSDGEHRVGGNRYLDNLIFGNAESGSLSERVSDAEVSGTVTSDPGLPSLAQLTGYMIPATSPAVDAGTCTDAPSRDLHGVTRPQGGGVDIGPYERPSGAGGC